MFALYYSHPFNMLSSEIDLRKSPHLRLLQLSLRDFKKSPIVGSQDDVIRWLNSICESVTSNSLVVEVPYCDEEEEICNKIQDTLLAMHNRIETFLVYLAPRARKQGVFSTLYEAGVVVEDRIYDDTDKQVSNSIPTSHLLYS